MWTVKLQIIFLLSQLWGGCFACVKSPVMRQILSGGSPTAQRIHAHTWEWIATSKLWNRSKEICQCKNPPECAGSPPLPERAGVQAIPAPAPFIRSLFTEVMISHRKYKDLIHKFKPFVFCSSGSYLCPLVGTGALGVPVLTSVCAVLMLSIKSETYFESWSGKSLKSSTTFEACHLHKIPRVWWILAGDCC